MDHRRLNQIIKQNHTDVLRTDEMFDRPGDTCVFSKLVYKTGFHKIRIKAQETEKTPFTTKYGQSDYIILAVGL